MNVLWKKINPHRAMYKVGVITPSPLAHVNFQVSSPLEIDRGGHKLP